MNETNETYRALRNYRQSIAGQRRAIAAMDFEDAQEVAQRNGFNLIRHSDSHYQIRFRAWIWNLYPGNQRIYALGVDVPFLNVTNPWRLMDAVKEVSKMV